jgi:cobalamin biosynthesis protein CobD/CbiB
VSYQTRCDISDNVCLDLYNELILYLSVSVGRQTHNDNKDENNNATVSFEGTLLVLAVILTIMFVSTFITSLFYIYILEIYIHILHTNR